MSIDDRFEELVRRRLAREDAALDHQLPGPPPFAATCLARPGRTTLPARSVALRPIIGAIVGALVVAALIGVTLVRHVEVASTASPSATASASGTASPSAEASQAASATPATPATPAPTVPGTPKAYKVEITAGPTIAIASRRTQYAATELADGRILLTGGYLGTGGIVPCGNGSGACIVSATATAEIYDPRTQAFSATGPMNEPRVGHAAVLLRDGRVLVVGGASDASQIPLGTGEVYDPATGRFTDLGTLHQDTSGDKPGPFSPPPSSYAYVTQVLSGQTLTVLADGRVLITGGKDGWSGVSNAVTVFDPHANKFTNLPGMPVAWANPAASLLADGRVLLTAGSDEFTREALLFDPATDTFTITGSTAVALEGSTQTVLPDGRVLIANGSDWCNEIAPETYDPAAGQFSLGIGKATSGVTPLLIPDGRVLLLGGANGSCRPVGQVSASDPDTGTVSVLASDALPDSTVDGAFVLEDGSVLVLTDEGAINLTLK